MIKYNETVIQYKSKNTESYGILIQYCIDKRLLQVKTYCYHNIHLTLNLLAPTTVGARINP